MSDLIEWHYTASSYSIDAYYPFKRPRCRPDLMRHVTNNSAEVTCPTCQHLMASDVAEKLEAK